MLFFPRRLLFVVFAASLLAGCAWSQPPAERDAVLPPYTVDSPMKPGAAGQLMLTGEGLWAFVDADSGAAPRLEAGDLVGFIPRKDSGSRHRFGTGSTKAPAHLFAVVLVRSWGAMLQRLDTRSVVSASLEGELSLVKSDMQFHRWGLCRGRGGDVAQSDCVKAAEATAAWRIYRIDERAKLAVPEADKWQEMTLPVRTDGLVRSGRALVDEDVVGAGWVAVPMRAAPPKAPHVRIAIQKGCPEIELGQGVQPTDVYRASFDAPRDAVDTEEAAIATGADALVICGSKFIEVASPTLYRPLVQVPSTSAAGIAYGAMRPIRVAQSNAAAMRATIHLAAAMGTGATAAADFYLEIALRASPDTDTRSALALGLMQISASAGRPEAALRAGRAAASGAWHVENNPAFVLGRSWAYAALGKQRAFVDSLDRLSKLAETPENEQTRLWLAWNALRGGVSLTGSRDVNGAMTYFEDKKMHRWLTAARLVVDPGQVRATGSKLAAVATPRDEACTGQAPCELDVYGRNFGAMVAAATTDEARSRVVESLATTAPAALRPGFGADVLAAADWPAGHAVALRAALVPLLSVTQRTTAFEAIVRQAASALADADACLVVPQSDLLDRRLAAASEAATDAGAIDATRWLVTQALPAACKSPAKFADSLETGLAANEVFARRVAPLFEAVLARAPRGQRMALLRRFAAFTAEHGKGAACKRWNLALAVSDAGAGKLDEAADKLSLAINCQAPAKAGYEQSQQLINAFLRFDRHMTVPDDISKPIRQKLLALTRQTPPPGREDTTCLGLLPLGYALTDYVAPDIAALAVAMPQEVGGSLSLETSSRVTERGIAAMVVARRLLGEARPHQAAKALLEARRAFEQVGHQVGLNRVAFIEKVLFDGDLQAAAEAANQWKAVPRAGAEATASGSATGDEQDRRIGDEMWAEGGFDNRSEHQAAEHRSHLQDPAFKLLCQAPESQR